MNDEITYHDYRTEVEQIVDTVLEIQAEYPEDYSDVSEIVWEEVDSHQWVIYYGDNLNILQHSDEGPQDWKHLVAEDGGWRRVIQAMAYSALENDVHVELNRREESEKETREAE